MPGDPALPRARPFGLLHAALAVVLAASAALLASVDPAAVAWLPACPFRALTGLLCPGCGTLRAAHQLLTGHPLLALRLNPLAFVLGPVALADLTLTLCGSSRPGRSRRLLRPFPAWSLPALVCGFWVIRNLPAGELPR